MIKLKTHRISVLLFAGIVTSVLADIPPPATALAQVAAQLRNGKSRVDFLGVSDNGNLCEVALSGDRIAYLFFPRSGSYISDGWEISDKYRDLVEGTVDSQIMSPIESAIAITLKSGEKFSLEARNDEFTKGFSQGKFVSRAGTCNLKRRLNVHNAETFILLGLFSESQSAIHPRDASCPADRYN